MKAVNVVCYKKYFNDIIEIKLLHVTHRGAIIRVQSSLRYTKCRSSDCCGLTAHKLTVLTLSFQQNALINLLYDAPNTVEQHTIK